MLSENIIKYISNQKNDTISTCRIDFMFSDYSKNEGLSFQKRGEDRKMVLSQETENRFLSARMFYLYCASAKTKYCKLSAWLTERKLHELMGFERV